MSEQAIAYDTIFDMALKLSLQERARLVEQLAATITRDLDAAPAKQPRRSLYGALADLNLDISREDIAEARREMMKNFPREDIA